MIYLYSPFPRALPALEGSFWPLLFPGALRLWLKKVCLIPSSIPSVINIFRPPLFLDIVKDEVKPLLPLRGGM